jgi:2-hydroxychromene-2-carboxylate isomerase
MAREIDYFLVPNSPYAYLGHARFAAIARAAGATVRVLPMDLAGRVFPISGGLPLAQRAQQRQAYRLLELKRFSDWLGMPMNLQPTYFPVAADDASRLIVAVDLKDGSGAAMALAGALLAAVWAQQRNIADKEVLAALLAEQGLPAQRIEDAHAQAVQERFDANTRYAIDSGVFGAPSYVIDGELFWGQDRLEFVQRRLARVEDGTASGTS